MADKTKNIDVDNNNKLKAIREMQEKNRMKSDNTSVSRPRVKSMAEIQADAIKNTPYPKGKLSGQDSVAFDEGMDRGMGDGWAGITSNKNFKKGEEAAKKIINQGKKK
jgi:hypothetical protein